jgi:hypothetical protein
MPGRRAMVSKADVERMVNTVRGLGLPVLAIEASPDMVRIVTAEKAVEKVATGWEDVGNEQDQAPLRAGVPKRRSRLQVLPAR